MRSKEVSIQLKEAITEIAKTLGMAKSTFWYNLKKKEFTSKLSKMKKACKTTEDN